VRVVLVCSSGGHLIQLHQLKPWWEKHERTWVTFDLPDGRSLLEGEDVVWAYHPTTRNIPNAARNLLLASRLLDSFRPDVVVTSGAGVGVPFIIAGRVRGCTTVFVEAFERVESPSRFGKRDLLALRDVGEHIATLPTRPAFPVFAVRGDSDGRRIPACRNEP